MAQIRKNIITGEYISVSPARKNRPVNRPGNGTKNCPFCPENSFMTPGEVFTSKSGKIRIFPNLYPILDKTDNLGYGIHEIVVDTNEHARYFHDFSAEHAQETLAAIIGRFPAIYADEKIRYVQAFKNQGPESGATISHSHWQIVGLPFVPLYQRTAWENFKLFHGHNGCYICNALKDEPQIIYENEGAAAFCPRETKFVREINVAPKKHFSAYMCADDQLSFFAEALQKSCKAVSLLPADYNICFQNMLENNSDFLHFYAQVIPRRGRFGGFELSTCSYCLAEYPENSAELLKETIANI